MSGCNDCRAFVEKIARSGSDLVTVGGRWSGLIDTDERSVVCGGELGGVGNSGECGLV